MDFINLWDVKPNKISHLMSYIVCPCPGSLLSLWLPQRMRTNAVCVVALVVSCPDQSRFRPHQSFSTSSFHTLFSENIR